MSRPSGVLRVELRAAAGRLLQQRMAAPLVGLDGQPVMGATWREIAAEAQVGWEAARGCVKNMVRSGELAMVGLVREEHSARAVGVYAPGMPARVAEDPGLALQMAWGARRHG